jgi:hypothetical protein
VTDVILIDFSKAFDVVPHGKLINKLASLGVCASTLAWIRAFLKDRFQQVTLNDARSEQTSVTSGVIQGSVLGPVLFVFYVNDLPDVCPNCSIEQFADDTKASKQITSGQDRVILQTSLTALCDWAGQHDLNLSLEKCVYLQIGYSDNSITYKIGARTLQPCSDVKDLGIAVQSSLKPGLHCTQVACKANIRAKLILKSFLSHDIQSLTRAFTTFVRPILEYATPVWCPFLKYDINLIESVQRSFTKKLFNLCHLAPTCYNHRLHALGLQRLETRRIIYDLCTMFKLTHGLLGSQLQHTLRYAPHVGTRGHRYKLFVAPARKLPLRCHFMHRIVNIWNWLPDNCFAPDTLSAFKFKLHTIDFSKFLRGSD